jgi:hypothetical protein
MQGIAHGMGRDGKLIFETNSGILHIDPDLLRGDMMAIKRQKIAGVLQCR